MPPLLKQNATSVPAASAAAQSTARSAASTVLPVSALADALVNIEGLRDGNQTQVPPASSSAGDAAPEPGAPGEGIETNPPPEGQTDPGNEPGTGEPAAGNEPLELTDPNAEPTEPEGQDLPGVKKRIGQLQAEIRQLRDELTKRPDPSTQPAPDNRSTSLDNINDVTELNRRADQAESGLEEVDLLLAKLSGAPQRVEQYLRANGVILKDDEGNEDFSPERMSDVLGNARQQFRQTLRAIPKRRSYLTEYQAAHAQVVQAIPWVGDRTDERHALMGAILGQFPGLRSAPNHEYWVAAAIEGDRAIKARLKGAGRPTTVAARPAANGRSTTGPNTSAGGGAPPRATAKAKVDAAKDKVLKEGSKQSLSAFFEAAEFVK